MAFGLCSAHSSHRVTGPRSATRGRSLAGQRSCSEIVRRTRYRVLLDVEEYYLALAQNLAR
jgi:hypothetical protein